METLTFIIVFFFVGLILGIKLGSKMAFNAIEKDLLKLKEKIEKE